MRTFKLLRLIDESGVSGVGYVAQGVEFDNGQCALYWVTEPSSMGIYQSIEDLTSIHGHSGKTEVVFMRGIDIYKGKLSKPTNKKKRIPRVTYYKNG
jgi:hypothetical protein